MKKTLVWCFSFPSGSHFCCRNGQPTYKEDNMFVQKKLVNCIFLTASCLFLVWFFVCFFIGPLIKHPCLCFSKWQFQVSLTASEIYSIKRESHTFALSPLESKTKQVGHWSPYYYNVRGWNFVQMDAGSEKKLATQPLL